MSVREWIRRRRKPGISRQEGGGTHDNTANPSPLVAIRFFRFDSGSRIRFPDGGRYSEAIPAAWVAHAAGALGPGFDVGSARRNGSWSWWRRRTGMRPRWSFFGQGDGGAGRRSLTSRKAFAMACLRWSPKPTPAIGCWCTTRPGPACRRRDLSALIDAVGGARRRWPVGRAAFRHAEACR